MATPERPYEPDRLPLPVEPEWLPVAAEILSWGNTAEDSTGFLASALPCFLGVIEAEFIAVVAPVGGQWTPIGQAGRSRPLPGELLADVLDLQRAGARGAWVAVPLGPVGRASEAVCVHCRQAASVPEAQRAVAGLAGVLTEALAAVRKKSQLIQRTRRLEAMLQAANRWFQTREMEPLLVEMAEAATRLLGADRASIFLWDKRTKSLVARPALGVPGGELRIPDDRGVVGRVVRSGQPLRIDAASAMQQYIDRQVDAQLGYQTRTLLCVPLRSSSGE